MARAANCFTPLALQEAGTAPLLLITVSPAPGTAPGGNTEKGNSKCLLELIKNIIILFNHTHTQLFRLSPVVPILQTESLKHTECKQFFSGYTAGAGA